MKTYVGINGVCGRMGQRILYWATRDPELCVGVALETADHAQQGHDAGEAVGLSKINVPITAALAWNARLDVMIDFSSPEGTIAVLQPCALRRIPVVIGTTGHTQDQRREIEAASDETAVLFCPNTTLTVSVLMSLVRRAAELLRGRGFDVEVIERHHRGKHSPGATAHNLATAIQDKFSDPPRPGRPVETHRDISVHSLRVGDTAGEYTVVFGAAGEVLELTQRATSREGYVRGALQAAKCLVGKPPGRYTMADVLGL